MKRKPIEDNNKIMWVDRVYTLLYMSETEWVTDCVCESVKDKIAAREQNQLWTTRNSK